MLSTRPASNQSNPATDSKTAPASLFSSLVCGALVLLLALAPSQLSGFWPASYDLWPQALWLLLGAGVTFLLALAPDAKVCFDAPARWLLAFLAWSALSLTTAVYKHDAFLEWARVFGALSPFFVARALWTPRRGIWLVAAQVTGLVWACFPAIYDFTQSQYPRQAGPFSNNNLFANALAMTLPLTLVLPFLLRRTALKVGAALFWLPFAICAFGLLVTSSKGGFLAGLVGLAVTGMAIWRAKKVEIRALFRRHRLKLSAALLVFALVFAVLGARMIAPRLRAALGSESNSTLFRVYVWRATLDMAREKSLLGFGPGAFPHVYPRFQQVSYTRHAHESYLQIAAESGVPALVFFLFGIGAAVRIGLARLKTASWPFAAGGMGAVAAFVVHNGVDSGFFTTSITIFLGIALAFLTATETQNALGDAPESAPKSRLNPAFIGATLLLAYGGNLSQKAASGEDLRFAGEAFVKNGAPALAAQKLKSALEIDPTSARLWSYLGNVEVAAGQDGRAALQRAAELQPTRASNWSNLARAAFEDGNPGKAERFYARALQAAPLDTRLRLERAMSRLSAKNSAGYADLEAILSLKTRPYGKYEPIEQNVNLDFARATTLMAPELRRRGENARLQILIQSALADCARARRFTDFNAQMQRESGARESGESADLESLTATLQALQTPKS